MPFELTPFMPYLTRFGDTGKPIAASTSGADDPKSASDSTKP
jgi:hypothetical protein